MEIDKINTELKKENFELIYKQLNAILDIVKEDDIWLATIYTQPITFLTSRLLTNQVTSESLEKFRRLLHICDSSIANMSTHIADEKFIIEDQKLFGYLYSVHDLLLDIIMYDIGDE